MSQLSLFAAPARETIAPGAVIMRAFADEAALLPSVLALEAPFRNMTTPGGFTMSVAITNCGALGWTTDARGYRYSPVDPLTGSPWPAIPPAWMQLAARAAFEAGYPDFVPDACLVNRYEPGAKMSLHYDKNERDFSHPIVSVSLGASATFQFGGPTRESKAVRHTLHSGDVVVWGGPSRTFYHGVLPVKALRYNLTFRRAA